eukprot:COSAG06_NODE_1547_length_9132_cov_3.139046_2_plen_44_part_00
MAQKCRFSQGIAANQIVRAAVTTLDLAATFIGRQTAFFAPINS